MRSYDRCRVFGVAALSLWLALAAGGCALFRGRTKAPPKAPTAPKNWTTEAKQVQAATPKGIVEKPITYHTNSIGMAFVYIRPGAFMMGSRDSIREVVRKSDIEPSHPQDEHPQHHVTITYGLYMGAYEVTQEQYEKIMGTNPSGHLKKGGTYPVVSVSWQDAVEFCRRLSAKEGLTYRLPREAEWENACRAGTTTPFAFGETVSTDQANYDGEYAYGSGTKGVYRQSTTPVGSFHPNGWGLYDMHGNAQEWCQDRYGSYELGARTDPRGPKSGSSHVMRGGSWNLNPCYCRSAYRGGFNPERRYLNYGFRVVCELPK